MLAVYIVGFATHKPSMAGYLWIVTALCVWIGALVFAPFGLFLGYLLPTENVMQFMGFIMILLAFGGGLFVPLSQYPMPCRCWPSSPPCTASTSWCTGR